MNDHDMRDAYERSLKARDGAAESTAVPLDALDALVHRTGSEAERLRTLNAAMSSAQGRREFEIARAAARAASPDNAARGKRRAYSTRWIGVAAALLVSTGAGAFWATRQQASVTAEPMRGTESPVQLVSPRGQITTAPGSRFTWHAVRSARSYTLVVVDRSGVEVFASSTSDTSLTLPGSVRLQAGERYLWWVQAELTDGTTLSAVTESLTVKPSPR